MIDYLLNENIKKMIDTSPYYQKTAQTGLRKPTFSELGQEFITYVLKDGQLRIEAKNTVTDTTIVARNSEIIGKINEQDVYNEWLIAKDVATKNYGQETIEGLSHEFMYHKKQAKIQAVKLTPEIMKTLGVEGDTLPIKVSWSPEPMIAHIGDYLTDSGFSVSAKDMNDTYQIVVDHKIMTKIQQLREKTIIHTTIKP